MSAVKELKVIKKRPEVRNTPDQQQDRENGRQLLETLLKGMVDFPETIEVSFEVGDKTTVYKVECDQKCLGQIIGAKGKNITGVRSVMAATLARKGIRAVVEIPYFCVDV
nr:hypothetical protein CKG001_20000 [Bdellovibrio sp. CKG001]BFD63300.1 hypothetical protein BdHM001_19810 [Bdellovibrio sp. HM001]BFD67154.1 hypothetical protein HAGR004_21760 [Bdellovibrio sp. HAGR004]